MFRFTLDSGFGATLNIPNAETLASAIATLVQTIGFKGVLTNDGVTKGVPRICTHQTDGKRDCTKVNTNSKNSCCLEHGGVPYESRTCTCTVRVN